MPRIETLGGTNKRTTFTYEGTVSDGVVLTSQSNLPISSRVFETALKEFEGRTVRGGFSMTTPPPDGFGAWIQANSKALNRRKLTSRHGSFIAAILVHEGRIGHRRIGNAIFLEF